MLAIIIIKDQEERFNSDLGRQEIIHRDLVLELTLKDRISRDLD